MIEENRITLFHGTTEKAALEILKKQTFNKSSNKDDWLGEGIYFYENIENAILYNIRKYYNENQVYPGYDVLNEARKILVVGVDCNEENILNLNEIENLQKFLGLWKIFFDKIKDSKEYRSLKYKDGYMINWLFKHTDYFDDCKVIKNIFCLDLRFKRKIDRIFNKNTRIGYTLNQTFWCIVDGSCIKNIDLYTKDYNQKYVTIKNFTNNILMGDDRK